MNASSAGFRVAVDIGGTFTDAVCVGPDGEIRNAKALTVPGGQDASVLDAIGQLGIELADVEGFIHGTTTALNALLERGGARLAMVVTEGFRDVYEIGRGGRPDMYNIKYRRPEMLLRRRDIFEVPERLGADGATVRSLDEDGLRRVAAVLADRGYEAVAVCFLHAYRYPEHEQRAKEVLVEALPTVSVVASHEVAPQWREYERFATTLVSAYVTPKISAYLGQLESRLAQEGLSGPLHVMQSNGGVMTAQMGVSRAVRTLFSGPVGGTVGCVVVGRHLGERRLVCVDMGGTSFDVSLVVDGAADIDTEIELEGHPILTPSVSMHSLGAGGGSLIRVESGGLRVGPESAGASPGPVCYGRGGDRPTITDANLVLGRIPGHATLGDTLRPDLPSATAAMAKVGTEVGMDATALAEGAVAVADAMMADAIRELTVARGIDPRDFGLLAFGGAGPLHAASLAEELGMNRVIVPYAPGVLSAWGMLQASVRHDLVHAYFATLDRAEPDAVEERYAQLRHEAAVLLNAEGVSPDSMILRAAADLRYSGQEYTLTVAVPAPFDADAPRATAEAFHAAYLERYGHQNLAETVELVNLRMAATGPATETPLPALPAMPAPSAIGLTRAVFAGTAHDAPVYERSDIGLGAVLDGPCVVMEPGCTTLVPPGWSAEPSIHGHLILERRQ